MNKPELHDVKILDFIEACNYLENKEKDKNWEIYKRFILSGDDISNNSFIYFYDDYEEPNEEYDNNEYKIFYEYHIKFKNEYPNIDENTLFLIQW